MSLAISQIQETLFLYECQHLYFTLSLYKHQVGVHHHTNNTSNTFLVEIVITIHSPSSPHQVARPREPPRPHLHRQERRLVLRGAAVGAGHPGGVALPGGAPREAAHAAHGGIQDGEAG